MLSVLSKYFSKQVKWSLSRNLFEKMVKAHWCEHNNITFSRHTRGDAQTFSSYLFGSTCSRCATFLTRHVCLSAWGMRVCRIINIAQFDMSKNSSWNRIRIEYERKWNEIPGQDHQKKSQSAGKDITRFHCCDITVTRLSNWVSPNFILG